MVTPRCLGWVSGIGVFGWRYSRVGSKSDGNLMMG